MIVLRNSKTPVALLDVAASPILDFPEVFVFFARLFAATVENGVAQIQRSICHKTTGWGKHG